MQIPLAVAIVRKTLHLPHPTPPGSKLGSKLGSKVCSKVLSQVASPTPHASM
jgi:hypothetical protein